MPPSPSEWPVTLLEPDVVVRVGRSMPVLSPETEACVASHWEAALAKHPSLYNGRVFCADVIEPDVISGHWSEYRRVLAQMREPDLYGPQMLRPLAVVGLLRTLDGIVIGQRSEHSIYLPSYWQGAPAGNVESREGEAEIDLAAQLLAECHEELGLTEADCQVGGCLLACEHPRTHIVDIGMDLTTTLDFESLKGRCRRLGNAEYQALKLVQPDTELPERLVPTLSAMLEQTR
ncbi:hypothetical protein [Gluconobacter sphaericus]|uniref:hypothetical protein n=1 Tax=Gluconobacter sphaericus TaxID=574987 RepID=UPI00114158C9|nr:hypothetical protein [Gluconobacter sphaericus]MBF0884514.1 hypothetical protein [Gluconobacter sphaericus]MBS1084789.1 hypothetical protein [Gluconobacter sphaericus]MBS1099566.1 hypothetical protein [Gluconobacter sphaericus]GBR53391.1 phosphohydrolase [Gluconobacter sphaericus NBRC 12467]